MACGGASEFRRELAPGWSRGVIFAIGVPGVFRLRNRDHGGAVFHGPRIFRD